VKKYRCVVLISGRTMLNCCWRQFRPSPSECTTLFQFFSTTMTVSQTPSLFFAWRLRVGVQAWSYAPKRKRPLSLWHCINVEQTLSLKLFVTATRPTSHN